MLKLSKYKAVICEGVAEQTIINILLDNNLLLFNRTELIDEDVLTCRSAKVFEQRYLRKSYNDKVSVIRILDSRREEFKISAVYKSKVDVINVITAPEIEILVIHSEKQYDAFKKSKMKPSLFCKERLHYKNIKSREFVQNYFSDAKKLVDAIKDYHKKAKVKKNEKTLLDLIK